MNGALRVRTTRIRAVIFDFDGTIADSLPARVQALRDCLSLHFGREVTFIEAHGVVHSASHLEEQLRRATGDSTAVRRLVQLYRERYYQPDRPPLPAYAGVREALQRLREQGVAVALVTSRYRVGAAGNPAWSVVWELDRMGLARAFDVVVGYEDTEEHKPAPQPFLACCQRLGVVPQQVLSVGDTPFDVEGARTAGLVSAAALWGASDRAALLAAAPDVAFHTPGEIPASIAPGT